MIRPENVVLHGLFGVVFHQGDMLVRRGVENDVRAVSVRDAVDLRLVPHGGDLHAEVQRRPVDAQKLLLDVVGVVLVDIQDDQPLRRVCGDLPAEFAADGAAAAGYQYGPSPDKGVDGRGVKPHRLTAQQVFDAHGFQVLHARVRHAESLADGGHGEHLPSGLRTEREHLAAVLHARSGYGENDLGDAVFFRRGAYPVPPAHNRHAVEILAVLVGVVVDQTDRPALFHLFAQQLPHQDIPRGAGADDHNALPGIRLAFDKDLRKAENTAHGCEQAGLQHEHGAVGADRQPGKKRKRNGQVDRERRDRGQDHTRNVRRRHRVPDEFVHPHDPEHQQRHRDLNGHDKPHPVHEAGGNGGEYKIEPDSQRQPVGKNKDQNVKKDDERRMIHSDPRFVFRFGLHDQGVSPVIIESQAYLYKYMIYHSAAVLSKQSPGRTSPGTYRFRDL